jgi:putative heme transporter
VWRLFIVGVVGIAVGSQWQTLVAAGRSVGRLSLGWVSLAVLAEVTSFLFAAELQHHLLGAARVRCTRLLLVALTYASSAVSDVLPAGAAVSARYSYRRLVRRDVRPGLAAWVLVVSATLSVSMLALLGLVGAQLRGLGVLCSTLGVVAGTIIIAAATGTVAALAWASRNQSRFDTAIRRLGRATEHAYRITHLRHGRKSGPEDETLLGNVSEPVVLGPRGWLRACALAAANWVTDWTALGATFVALGLHVPWSGLLWAYVATQVAGSVPVLGCVGLAEGTMTIALACIGVPAAPAIAVVLIYRLLSFWITLPTGWLASRYLIRAERSATSSQTPTPENAVIAA